MTIFLSSQANVSSNDGIVSILDTFGQAASVPGLGTGNQPKSNILSPDAQAVLDFGTNILSKLLGGQSREMSNRFVGSGKKAVVGGNIQHGKVPPLEDAASLQIYSQSPNFSVIVKKRAFSSLQHLYKPELMEPAELWLLRATKRLIARKCAVLADYERLSKIQRLSELGVDAGSLMASLIAGLAEQSGQLNFFTSAMNLQRLMLDREPVEITTYFNNTSLPYIEEFGIGNGVFEITAISSLNTNLSLESGNLGGANFSIEDPFHILLITEEDIEAAIRETSLSNFVDIVNRTASAALSAAQEDDARLSELRRTNGKSQISFNVDIRGSADVKATIDAIGFEITNQNLNDVPENQALDDDERAIFLAVFQGLQAYTNAMRKSLLTGLSINTGQVAQDVAYARKMMRKFYLGKLLIQPMDTVNIFIDGATRRLGEGEDPFENDITTLNGAVKVASDLLGLADQAVVDDNLLEIEYQREGQFLTKDDFKKLKTLQSSGSRTGTSVFGGLVNAVNDKYNAQNGTYVINVSCNSNMEWLAISRYNKEPSLDQTQGLVLDPLTPFDFEVDMATGLPIGKPKLSKANQQFACKRFFNSGPNTGAEFTESSFKQDTLLIGGNLIDIYQHAPGLLYKWKEGIMTAVYNAQTVNPLDGTRVNLEQLHRDVGFFASHSPFDNMDSANIISIMVTGIPYNFSSFINSTRNTGAYNPDVALNDGKDFFHSFLSIISSVNKVQGSFIPYKILSISLREAAKASRLQFQLSNISSEIKQLRNQEATLQDKIKSLSADADDSTTIRIVRQIQSEIKTLQDRLSVAENNFLAQVKDSRDLTDNVVSIVGDDVMFDLEFGGSPSGNDRLFGDRLLHTALRRREDVINNRDKNFLIISDQYDKDFDIQSFALQLRRHGPKLWQSTWQSALELCKRVAETLDFEFYCSTQGHIEFRPPQYNRTPLSVLQAMFTLDETTGVRLFPDFLTSLFERREASLLTEIKILEWDIRLKAALLGSSTDKEINALLASASSGPVFLLTEVNDPKKAFSLEKIRDPGVRESLLEQVRTANTDTQIRANQQEGLFNAVSQSAVQQLAINTNILKTKDSDKNAYDRAKQELAKLRGDQIRNFEEFDKAKVGVVRNGQSSPAGDVFRIINNISTLLAQRAKLLRVFERVLEQNVEVGTVNQDGRILLNPTKLQSTLLDKSNIFGSLIEDDTNHILGHMSGSRFIIKDEDIIDMEFIEKPPQFTNIRVNGTDPIVGQPNGNISGGFPVYAALGVDFDLWRQYGFRGEQSYDKPFFWDAQLQCAPYAVMLLSRQRKNIVTGSITIVGNEFYQLGDVVYVVDRQMLFYVNAISHGFNYNGQFTTRLSLNYGHAPGEYIPTPTDVMGKGLINRDVAQTAYRVRRQTPVTEKLIGTIKFANASTHDPFIGDVAKRNFNELVNAAQKAKADVNPSNPLLSSRVYIMTFSSNDNHTNQMNAVKNWFISPNIPGEQANLLGPPNPSSLTNNKSADWKIQPELLFTQQLRQCIPSDELSPVEVDLLKDGLSANNQSFALDRTLETVVEIRLRQPPPGGWT